MVYSRLKQTKFYPPLQPSDYVNREILHKRLTSGLEMPFTLVSAPGGYGKSTLVSSWALKIDRPYCWISLEESENSIITFLDYLIYGIQKFLPSVFTKTENLIRLPEFPSLESLITNFTNELLSQNQPFIVILDDYHKIHDKQIHDFIQKLLQFPIPGFHLIIITRADPPFPIPLWRSQSKINEIRRKDLEFKNNETISLLEKKSIKCNPNETLEKLIEVSEGWIAGLRSLLYGISNEYDLQNRLENDTQDSTGLFYYGMQELLSLKPDFEEFLLNACLLNQFCAEELVYMSKGELDSVLNVKVSSFLQFLVSRNLFIIPLDSECHWFRFHHLFHDFLYNFLKRKTSKEKINTLLASAGEWLSNEGYSLEAIRTFIQSNEFERAIRLFDHFRWKLLKELNWIELNELFQLFPNEIIKSSIALRLAESWILIYQGRPFEMFELLPCLSNDIQRLKSSEEKNRYLAELNALLPYQLYNINEHEKCIECCYLAIDNLESDQLYAKGYAYIFLLGSLQAIGRYEESIALFKQLVEGNKLNILNTHLYLVVCYLHWIEGNPEDLILMSEELIKLGKVQDNNEAIANGLHFKGLGHYANGDIKEALISFQRAFLLRQFTIGVLNVMNSISLFICLLKQGFLQDAEEVYKILKDTVSKKPDNIFEKMVDILRLELMMAKNTKEEIQDYLNQVKLMPITNQTNYYIPRQTLINAYLYLSDTTSLKKAEELISELENFLKNKFFKVASIRVEMLRTILTHKQGKNTTANLSKLFSLCRPKNLLCMFFEGGRELSIILKEWKGERDRFISRALSLSCPSESHPISLSKREEEILKFMDLSNKEISEKLFISEKTVKSHIHNIFRKLKVESRIEAIKTLGI